VTLNIISLLDVANSFPADWQKDVGLERTHLHKHQVHLTHWSLVTSTEGDQEVIRNSNTHFWIDLDPGGRPPGHSESVDSFPC